MTDDEKKQRMSDFQKPDQKVGEKKPKNDWTEDEILAAAELIIERLHLKGELYQ